MAITKPTRNMLSTGVSDSSDATFLTADSSENATFAGNLIVTGNLTVSGTQTVVSSTVETHADPLIELNTGAGSNSNDLGFVFERGSTGDNAALIWDESADGFLVGTTTATGTSTGNMSVTAGDFAAGKITVDNILINGTTIGHTGDTDLLTFASGVLTVAGEVSATTLDIGGTNITSTAAEINLLDALDRGSILYGNASGVTTVLGQGSADQVLTSDGTDISWEDAGGVSALGGLDEGHVVSGSGDFAGSILISNDGVTGTLDAAYYNTGYGWEAFDDLTTGDSNTAIGNQAGYKLTSGSNNTAVGKSALESDIDGHGNTAIGKDALKLTTPGGGGGGDQNTAVGTLAMDANTEGRNNTGIGYGSLGANSTGDKNTAVGLNSLGLNQTTDFNVAVGNGSLYNNIAAGNTAVGYNALTANTSGIEVTAVGYGALDVSTGSYNTAVGYEAGGANVTGTFNTFIGQKAGIKSTGSHNTFIGAATGYQNTVTGSGITCVGREAGHYVIGDDNTLVGYQAGFATTGAYNTAFGRSALYTNQTGTYNTAIGRSALANYTGGHTVAVGRNALFSNSSGTGNTAVGNEALTGTTGSQNTAIGKVAGQTNTDGNYNVFLGHDTRGSSGSASAQIVIGTNLTGTTDNAVFIGTSAGHSRNDFLDDANWDDVSDVRKKTNIEDSTMGLQFINKLRPVIFNWKSPSELPEEWQEYNADDTTPITPNKKIGLIAQEVKEAIDSLGITHYDSTWGVRENGQQELALTAYIVPLIKSVQELSQDLTNRNQEISDLEQRIYDIEQRLI